MSDPTSDRLPVPETHASDTHRTANVAREAGASDLTGVTPGQAAPVLGQGLRKRFGRGGPWVLDGADLAVPRGRLTVVAGGNGSGKSTLLRLLAGAGRPTAGVVRNRPDAVAYVPERLPGRGPMTAREYLTHLGRIRRLPVQTVRQRSAMLLDRLGLVPGPDVPITELSKGNAQKVALAQAFLAPVGLIVLDEPHTGLDEPARHALGGMLWDARGAGVAILISAHDYREVPGADAVHLLVNGRVHPVPVEPAQPPAQARAQAPAAAAPAADPLGAGTDAEPDALGVLLTAVGESASLDELSKDPYVVVVDGRPQRCRLVVPAGHADQVLVRALSAGWSLREAWPEHLPGALPEQPRPGEPGEGRAGW